MAIGYIVAQVANKVIDHFKVERDTRLRSYVMLHPELFPEPSMNIFYILKENQQWKLSLSQFREIIHSLWYILIYIIHMFLKEKN